MHTVWNGYGLPTVNMVWSEAFVPRSCPVLLPDTPHVVVRVSLPPTTHGVLLWTDQAQVWYAFDEDPGPIPPPAGGIVIAADAFMAGGMVMPGAWHGVTLPNDSLPHSVHLVSASPSPLVLVTALTELA